MSRTSFRTRLGLLSAVALVWRVFYILRWKGDDRDLSDEGDAFYYSAQAVVNARGELFTHPHFGGPAADHPPVTSLLVTPVSWIDDPLRLILAQRLVMALVGTLTVVVIGLIGRRLAGPRAGLLAATLAAGYAALWMNDALVMAEAPAALCTALLLLGALAIREDPTVRRLAVYGALAGVATLTRAELALLLPALAVPALWSARSVPPSARRRAGAAAVAMFCLVLAPWVVWNLSRFEEPTLLSTNDGLTLLGANCHSTYFTPAIGFWDLRCALAHPVEGDQSEVSAAWRAEGLSYARDNLGRLPKVAVARVGRVWGVYEPRQMVFFNGGEGREAWASWTGMYQSWVLYPVAAVGAVVLRRRRQPVLPLLTTVGTVTLTGLAFYGIVRFRVPADVALVVLGGVALDAAWRAIRPDRSSTSAR